ncbi:MAG: discoidin domain-containing protein, partial [Nonomuraea sp.]|nr:discoidin domain-containing protein [Nonomuraea sp.]
MKLRPTRAVIAALAGLLAVPLITAPAYAEDPLLSQGKTATASSTEHYGTAPAQAVDGDDGTRWSSVAGDDPQWLRVDLGAPADISKVVLNWEAAYATGYRIQISQDGTTWTDVKTVTGGDGGVDSLDVTGNGRYVRMLGTA